MSFEHDLDPIPFRCLCDAPQHFSYPEVFLDMQGRNSDLISNIRSQHGHSIRVVD